MTKQHIKQLAQIKTINDIKSLNIIDQYEDDHQQCADVEINGIDVEFLWFDNLGFLEYYEESAKAAAKLLNAIQYIVYTSIEQFNASEMDDELQTIHLQMNQTFK